MYGNELNYAMTAFTVGYIVGEIPSNILLTRIRPSIYIPSLQVRNLIFLRNLTTQRASQLTP